MLQVLTKDLEQSKWRGSKSPLWKAALVRNAHSNPAQCQLHVQLQSHVLGALHPTGPMSGLSQADSGIPAAVITAKEVTWQCKAQQQHT